MILRLLLGVVVLVSLTWAFAWLMAKVYERGQRRDDEYLRRRMVEIEVERRLVEREQEPRNAA